MAGATPTVPATVGGGSTQQSPTAVAGDEACFPTATADTQVGGGGPVSGDEQMAAPLSAAEEAGVPVTGAENAAVPTAVLGVEATEQALQAPLPFTAGEEQMIPVTGADIAPRALPLSGLALAQQLITYLGLVLIGIAAVFHGLARRQ